MSSRALRKAQREREEQDRLNRLAQEPEEETEDDVIPVQPAKTSAFAMLGEAEDVEEDEGLGAEQGDDNDDQAQSGTVPSIPKSSAKKRKKKKKKPKAGGTPQEPTSQDDQSDEIDKALKQLSTNGGTSLNAATASGINSGTDEMCKLLAVDTSHLHAQNEMRRLFGRAALEQQDEEEPQNAPNVGGNRRQQRRVQQIGLAQALRGQPGQARGSGLAAMALRRNIFIHGKEEWPSGTSGGLGMEVEDKRADGTVLYKFVHNSAYRDVQSQFRFAVETMDPNSLVALLQRHPYHISTLLQVSEVAKQERENAVSGDLLERALFTFGRAIHSSFAKVLSDGKARLDFSYPSNREFWLAAWRYMQNLSQRATWRTVYEWAKLLLAISPEDDPYAIWLVLDQYALRARQDLDYLNLSRSPVFKDKLQNHPNVQLSQGLAEFRSGDQGKGKQALFKAVGRYPWVAARLMHEINAEPIPPAIWGKEPRSEKEKLYTELYATRAKDLWNTPEASALLIEVASALPPDTPSASVDNEEITENEARHVLLSDTPSLIALIPRNFTSAIHSTSDPLPPGNSYPALHGSSNSGGTMETIERDIESAYDQIDEASAELDSLLPNHDQNGDLAGLVNRAVEEAGPEQARRILTTLQRLEQLQLRVSMMERNRRGQSGAEVIAPQEVEAASTQMRASVEDASTDDDD